MLVVLDTNIIISALLSPAGAPGQIWDAWREGRFEVVSCAEQLEEIRTVSRYPKLRALLRPHRVGVIVHQLQRSYLWAGPLPRVHEAENPQDSFLLNLAEATSAHYLVTGDKRSQMLARKKVGSTVILSARRFCEEVLRL